MKIIYQDEQLIVVDKPAGLSVLPDGWEKDSEYLVKLLEEEYGKLFIIHRLDKIGSLHKQLRYANCNERQRDREQARGAWIRFHSH